jgi:uncharacterized protein (DUF488 family)
MTLFTAGYGRWPTAQRLRSLLGALKAAKVTLLVDIRHSPCPPNTDAQSNYGPRGWHLLDRGKGLDGYLRHAGIEYLWLVELGNPQKTDPKMAILRSHLANPNTPWPVNRGLTLLHEIMEGKGRTCALLCACKKYDNCHRKVIAEALSQRYFDGHLTICDL